VAACYNSLQCYRCLASTDATTASDAALSKLHYAAAPCCNLSATRSRLRCHDLYATAAAGPLLLMSTAVLVSFLAPSQDSQFPLSLSAAARRNNRPEVTWPAQAEANATPSWTDVPEGPCGLWSFVAVI